VPEKDGNFELTRDSAQTLADRVKSLQTSIHSLFCFSEPMATWADVVAHRPTPPIDLTQYIHFQGHLKVLPKPASSMQYRLVAPETPQWQITGGRYVGWIGWVDAHGHIQPFAFGGQKTEASFLRVHGKTKRAARQHHNHLRLRVWQSDWFPAAQQRLAFWLQPLNNTPAAGKQHSLDRHARVRAFFDDTVARKQVQQVQQPPRTSAESETACMTLSPSVVCPARASPPCQGRGSPIISPLPPLDALVLRVRKNLVFV